MQPESLFRLSLTKSAISVLEAVDLRKELSLLVKSKKFWNLKEFNDRWQKLKDVMRSHVDKLQSSFLPQVKECLKETITPISVELGEWLEVFHKLNCVYGNIFEDLVWESNGSLDALQTVKKIIKRREVKRNARVYLACLFCVEEEIKNLWIKNGSFSTAIPDFKFRENSADKIITYWSYKITNSNHDDDKQILPCLKIACDLNLYEAVKYFYNKLSPAGKCKKLLLKCLANVFGIGDSNNCELTFPPSSKTKTLLFLLGSAAVDSNFPLALQLFFQGGTLILDQCVSYPFRHYYELYMKNCANYIDDEKSLRNSISSIAVRISEDREVYEKIFEFLYDEYIKRGYDVLLLFKEEAFIEHLLRFKGYRFVDLILNKVDAEEKEDFLKENGRSIAETLFYEEQVKVLEDFLKKCLRDKKAASDFRKSELRMSELFQFFCPAFGKNEKLEMIGPWHELLDRLVASYE